jgi:hypothetical protein
MIAFLFLLKKNLDGGISSGKIGVSSSRWMTLELGTSKLVDKGVTEGIGEISAVGFSGLVTLGVTMVVTGDEGGKA